MGVEDAHKGFAARIHGFQDSLDFGSGNYKAKIRILVKIPYDSKTGFHSGVFLRFVKHGYKLVG